MVIMYYEYIIFKGELIIKISWISDLKEISEKWIKVINQLELVSFQDK